MKSNTKTSLLLPQIFFFLFVVIYKFSEKKWQWKLQLIVSRLTEKTNWILPNLFPKHSVNSPAKLNFSQVFVIFLQFFFSFLLF